MRSLVPVLALATAALLACSAAAPPPPIAADHYADPSAWLCLPGSGSACAIAFDGETAIGSDNVRTDVPPSRPPAESDVDCFYVYPTVDLSLRPANHDDFTDLSKIIETTRSQAARFGRVCSLYVPLYRQVTIGRYLRRGEQLETGLALAYSDVSAAFHYYLSHFNHGHRIVLLGHSQGAEMVKRLLLELFDNDPAMRAKLVVALALGGDFEVPSGQTTGGTLRAIPVCTALGQAGCLVGYRSFRDTGTVSAADPPIPLHHEAVCVNPASLADPSAVASFDAAYFRTGRLKGVDDVKAPFATFPGLYQGHCVAGAGGERVLAIAETLGARTSPVDLGARLLNSKLGTHILDFQIAQDNLIRIVVAAAHLTAPQ